MKNLPAIRLKSGTGIGHGHPCFVVAEIGNNHQGELALAMKMVEEAAKCGVQAVKFQKRHMSALFTSTGLQMPYPGPNSFGPTYGEHRRALELSIEDMAELKAQAESLGLVFFASAWDAVSLMELNELGVEILKICSADLVNVPMLRLAGRSGIPVIMSTGMSGLEEIDLAVSEIRKFHDNVVILHCNSTYPCPDEQVCLPVMAELSRRYRLPVGYSGHEQGVGPSVAASALGACVVERHFTLDRTLPGTDHQASLEPADMTQMVRLIRETEAALRLGRKEVFESERMAAVKLRKSVVFARDLPAGHVLTEADITVKCPGNGISPIHWDDLMGRTLITPVRHEEQVRWEQLALSARRRLDLLKDAHLALSRL